MSMVVAKSVAEAIPDILAVLARESSCEVWIPPTFCGYWAKVKPVSRVPEEMTEPEFKREYRRFKSPQPYDVILTEWPASFYRGYHAGKKSSAF